MCVWCLCVCVHRCVSVFVFAPSPAVLSGIHAVTESDPGSPEDSMFHIECMAIGEGATLIDCEQDGDWRNDFGGDLSITLASNRVIKGWGLFFLSVSVCVSVSVRVCVCVRVLVSVHMWCVCVCVCLICQVLLVFRQIEVACACKQLQLYATKSNQCLPQCLHLASGCHFQGSLVNTTAQRTTAGSSLRRAR